MTGMLFFLALLFAGLAVCMLAFGLPIYRALLMRTKVQARKEDSIITYPLA